MVELSVELVVLVLDLDLELVLELIFVFVIFEAADEVDDLGLGGLSSSLPSISELSDRPPSSNHCFLEPVNLEEELLESEDILSMLMLEALAAITPVSETSPSLLASDNIDIS